KIGVLAHESKLLTAPAGKKIRASDTLLHKQRQPSEHSIAHSVSISIIDGLKVIDIQHHDGQGPARTPTLGQPDLQRFFDTSAVKGAGERVGLGFLLQLPSPLIQQRINFQQLAFALALSSQLAIESYDAQAQKQ